MTNNYNKLCELNRLNKIKGNYIITTNTDKLKRINYMKYNKNGVENNKPYGFWFSIGNEWIEYIIENNFNNYMIHIKYIISIKVKKSSKILIISGKTINGSLRNKVIKNNTIDWKYIFDNYDGLILNSNYINDMDTDIYSLFYGWDIKSGVIWRNVRKYVEYGKIITL